MAYSALNVRNRVPRITKERVSKGGMVMAKASQSRLFVNIMLRVLTSLKPRLRTDHDKVRHRAYEVMERALCIMDDAGVMFTDDEAREFKVCVDHFPKL